MDKNKKSKKSEKKNKTSNNYKKNTEFEKIPEIKKNEVVQGKTFFDEIKKYQGKETINYLPIILLIILIITVLIIILL